MAERELSIFRGHLQRAQERGERMAKVVHSDAPDSMLATDALERTIEVPRLDRSARACREDESFVINAPDPVRSGLLAHDLLRLLLLTEHFARPWAKVQVAGTIPGLQLTDNELAATPLHLLSDAEHVCIEVDIAPSQA